MSLEWTVEAVDVGLSLSEFLRKRLKSSSGKKIKKILDSGLCEVNGIVRSRGNYALSKGDRVLVYISSSKDLKMQQHQSVLYENDSLIVINKPSGINSESFSDKYYLIHRLDKMTSGALLLAKNSNTQQLLIEQFRNRTVKKLYLAVVDGHVNQSDGHIENFLGVVNEEAGQKNWGEVPSSKGKRAITDWRLISSGIGSSLVIAEPVTGRTHQIRLHLLSMGHAILGDIKYCQKYSCHYRPKRLMLHALKIAFVDPIEQNTVVIFAPIPDDFTETLNELKIDYENLNC